MIVVAIKRVIFNFLIVICIANYGDDWMFMQQLNNTFYENDGFFQFVVMIDFVINEKTFIFERTFKIVSDKPVHFASAISDKSEN